MIVYQRIYGRDKAQAIKSRWSEVVYKLVNFIQNGVGNDLGFSHYFFTF